MWRNLRLGRKLFLAFLLVGIVPIVVVGALSCLRSQKALTAQSYAGLAAIAEYKTQVLERWLQDRTSDIHAIPLTPFYVQAAKALTGSDREAAEKAGAEILHEFEINRKLHGYYREMKLLDLQGNHLVSLEGIRENEAGKSWFQEALQAARRTVKGGQCQDLYIGPIEHCSELGLPSIHMAHVIRDRQSFEPIAVVAVDCDVDQLMEIIQNRTGMGETGESYLVGADGKMRSNSRFASTPTIFSKTVDSAGVREVFKKRQTERGPDLCRNERYENGEGVEVLAHNHYVAGLDVALISEIPAREALAAVTGLQRMTLVSLALALLAVAVVATLIARSITRPILKTAAMIDELEKGHLQQRLRIDSQDEIGQMARTMDLFADSLQQEVADSLERLADGDLTGTVTPRDEQDILRGSLLRLTRDLNLVVGDIQAAAEQIAIGSTQVADTSQSLSQGATESAASIEQISASMTEMASQTKNNAGNASQASQLSTGTREAARRGSELMSNMMRAMEDIDHSSRDISRINKVIDDIAFQTNLLALNAAVEAARAGQHGKGFAVVAEEVRSLAARSAKAAQETAELIESAAAKTRNGSEIAGHTSAALQEILTAATKATDLIGEIAESSNEQSEGIGQVNLGLGQIDQVTQQNTANAEESAAAAEELAGQADRLRQMLARFRLEKGAALPGAALPRPALEEEETGSPYRPDL
jgi:methyl-accepting chemotaxis protein